MNTYMCQQCQCIWNDFYSDTICPSCYKKTTVLPISFEKSILFRLFQSHGNWSLECKGYFEKSNRFEKVSWKDKPPRNVLNDALNEYLKKWLEE